MIHVLELPSGGEPLAWFAYDDDDLLRKVAAQDEREPWEIWDCRSPRDLLELFDVTPDTPGAAERFPGIFAFGTELGWDTPLYRADDLREPGQYGPEPVTPLDACRASLRARVGECRIWPSDVEVLRAFESKDEPLWQDGGWRARWALRQQLVEIEILAED